MLKSFNSLLIDKVEKVECVSSGNILPEIFFCLLYVHEFFFWHDGLVQNFFFSYAYFYIIMHAYFYIIMHGYTFFKSPIPTPHPLPPSVVKWSALNHTVGPNGPKNG